MLEASATDGQGKKVLLLGLSFGNLDALRAGPGKIYIRIDGAKHGLPADVLVFSGETEAELLSALRGNIGPGTKVDIDPGLKQ
jgi:hypothetical protein